MATQPARLVVVGRIAGIYGVRGWVKIISHTSPPENILGYRNWQLRRHGQWQPVELLEGHPQGKGLVASLVGLVDRDQARAYIGAEIAVPRNELPPLPEGEYYWTDLEGLRVSTVEGEELGVLDHLLETGANDVLVVVKDGRQLLIPYVREQVVKQIDLAAGTMTVDWDPDF